MILTIHQPDFMPWLGFFERWRQSDLLILLDDVQFLRRGWHHRDRIKTANGPAWLTVPTRNKGKYHQNIKDVVIDNSQKWRRKHLGIIRNSYKQAPCFKQIYRELEEIYQLKHETLLEFNIALLDWIRRRLDIKTAVQFASAFKIAAAKTERLVTLCRKVGAGRYLSGLGAQDYIEESHFESAGIELIWHRFEQPAYPQLHGPFVPNLSVLDFLMMEGGHA